MIQLTNEQFEECIKAAHMAGQQNQGCDPSAYEAMAYYQTSVNKLMLPHVSDSLHIDFACYLTGHDRETVEQMYNDWRR